MPATSGCGIRSVRNLEEKRKYHEFRGSSSIVPNKGGTVVNELESFSYLTGDDDEYTEALNTP